MKKNCPYCSQPIYDSAKRCPFCGRNLDFELAKKLEKQKTDRERFHKLAIAALVAFVITAGVVVLTIWAAVYSPIGANATRAATQTAIVLDICNPTQVSAAAHQLIDFNDRWADIMALAVSVDHNALVLQVDRLQKIRRDVKSIQTPVCLKSAKQSLLDGMDTHINGFLAYMREEVPVEKVNEYLAKGNIEINSFADEVERIQKCAPGCH